MIFSKGGLYPLQPGYPTLAAFLFLRLGWDSLRHSNHAGLVTAAALSAASAARFRCPDKGAHEFAIDQRGDRIHIDAGFDKKMPRIFDGIHTRGLHGNAAESRLRQLGHVFPLLKRAGNAT